MVNCKKKKKRDGKYECLGGYQQMVKDQVALVPFNPKETIKLVD